MDRLALLTRAAGCFGEALCTWREASWTEDDVFEECFGEASCTWREASWTEDDVFEECLEEASCTWIEALWTERGQCLCWERGFVRLERRLRRGGFGECALDTEDDVNVFAKFGFVRLERARRGCVGGQFGS